MFISQLFHSEILNRNCSIEQLLAPSDRPYNIIGMPMVWKLKLVDADKKSSNLGLKEEHRKTHNKNDKVHYGFGFLELEENPQKLCK
jgi:hypothetical protein